ncbi:MAG: 23S rRNA (uracil(1939)-C(5))-methyltransferase RlmD [Candidatus Latescibacterota bacterium]|nr:MAG: 23S rRNA (uracil(1939)-C(5))-methyltransferase RlmD [Candidatus Latescibacterota bacterium]
MRYRRGQEIDVEVERVAIEGRGVGRVDGIVVFVDKGLPGERVRARVSRVKRSFVHARVVEVVRPSPLRIPGRCVHLPLCGGCTWQELDYEAQLDAKTGLVQEALERLGGFRGIEIPRALASPERFFYRNKMEFSFFAGSDGEPVLGLHTPGTFDRVFDLEACHLMSESSNAIVARVRDLARRSGLAAYHSRRHEGFWRYLVVREGKNTGQTMVNLVTNAGPLPNRGEVVDTLKREVPALTSLLRNINTRRATIAVGEEQELLYGAAEIDEILAGLRFRISANSFFQPNPRQAERLFELVCDWADPSGGDEILDLYAGTGVISLFLARRARRVTGIELARSAVADAERNAQLNGVDNCRFLAGEVRDFFKRRAAEARVARLVIADPPRAGLHADVVRALRLLRPVRILYVSCNPSTLARDLQLLCRDDFFRLRRVQPVDMFPHTYHVETVAELVAQSPS